MAHKKFIVFEGNEGTGKSTHIKYASDYLAQKKIDHIVTREPGGTKGAEIIRKLILKDYFYHNPKERFSKYTDTLLYLAARNEHIAKKIRPAILKKKIILCDRFTDSTLAYQVYGKGVSKNFDLAILNEDVVMLDNKVSGEIKLGFK